VLCREGQRRARNWPSYISRRSLAADRRLAGKRVSAGCVSLYSPSARRRCSSRIWSAMLVCDSRTNSAKGAFGRHERQDSAGMRLDTVASGWRSSLRRSMLLVERHAGQRTHRNQWRAAMAAPIVGENSIGIRAAWRSSRRQSGARHPQAPEHRSRGGLRLPFRRLHGADPLTCGD
jgi:hypothetical protein